MNVVLLEPEIPPNTGNIARLCAATGSRLHLIEPLGFSLEDRDLKRAGMDYWEQVSWRRWKSWAEFHAQAGSSGRFWLIESNAGRNYTEVSYQADDYLVFGRETSGLPDPLLRRYEACWVRIPMFNPASRSLNLSNAVAIILYEALRQQGFPGEV